MIKALLEQRHKSEKQFFDDVIRKKYENISNFKLTNDLNYQQLFSRIQQFKHIVDFFADVSGKNLLDLACGIGWVSLYFARSGANVFCCDISPESIEVAKKFAFANGLQDRIYASVMPAESLEYEDDFFEFVFMNAALHHCDIEMVSREIVRVLRPKGKAVIIDDYGYHPLMRLYRLLTKNRHTKYEKPLKSEDIEKFVEPFSQAYLHYFQLVNVVQNESSLSRILNRLDDFLLIYFPFLNRYCRLVAIYVVKG